MGAGARVAATVCAHQDRDKKEQVRERDREPGPRGAKRGSRHRSREKSVSGAPSHPLQQSQRLRTL